MLLSSCCQSASSICQPAVLPLHCTPHACLSTHPTVQGLISHAEVLEHDPESPMERHSPASADLADLLTPQTSLDGNRPRALQRNSASYSFRCCSAPVSGMPVALRPLACTSRSGSQALCATPCLETAKLHDDMHWWQAAPASHGMHPAGFMMHDGADMLPGVDSALDRCMALLIQGLAGRHPEA